MEQPQIRTLTLAVTPVVVAAGFVARPYVSDFTDPQVVAAAITGQPQRWLVASVLMVAGAVLLAFALPAAVQRVRGGQRWVRPAITIGVVGFALQIGLDGFGGVAANRADADVAAFLQASPGGTMIGISLIALLVAWIGVGKAVWTSALPTATTWVVIVGAAIGVLGHLYPSSIGEYIASAGTAAALWPLAAHQPEPDHTT